MDELREARRMTRELEGVIAALFLAGTLAWIAVGYWLQ